ncbi:hypothetical protein E2562_006548 [Oryza meyeriana var. granulata]|uniref:Uncharacterized protein n=1 Tax=Oryza meyeriana var. granulata TaxID=110450 RepID=A0A6G1BT73_9ORYZ|nr:hypothetical protein E2562_006548 [Oryza meyeriana var. granulata]
MWVIIAIFTTVSAYSSPAHHATAQCPVPNLLLSLGAVATATDLPLSRAPATPLPVSPCSPAVGHHRCQVVVVVVYYLCATLPEPSRRRPPPPFSVPRCCLASRAPSPLPLHPESAAALL